MSNNADDSESGSDAFPKTRWGMVHDAQKDDPRALADLCRTYWYPLYCYARRLRNNHQDAEDLTQAFFQRLLANEGLSNAREKSGKLRSFLLRSLENFAIDDWRRNNTQKRGGHHVAIDIDGLDAEQRYALESKTTLSPALEFDRVWARQLLQEVLNRLSKAYEEAGKIQLFTALQERLIPERNQRPYSEIAEQVGVSESLIRLAAFKLRKRFREMLKEAIAETVSSEEEIEEELMHLRSVFGEQQ